MKLLKSLGIGILIIFTFLVTVVGYIILNFKEYSGQQTLWETFVKYLSGQ